MAPNPRVVAAFTAMANLGIHESKVKPVLKKLLKLYDKNWQLIEEESYRALADAIFEEEENQDGVDDEEARTHEAPLRPLKRLRLRGQEGQSSRPMTMTSGGPSSGAFPLKTPKLEDGTVPEKTLKGPTVEPGATPTANKKMPPPFIFIKPKDEPVDELPDYEIIPISVILPEPSSGRDSLMGEAENQDGHDTVLSQCRDEDVEGEDILPSYNEEATSNVNVVLSSTREVKISVPLWRIIACYHIKSLTLIYEFGTDSNNNPQEHSLKIAQADDVAKEFETNGSPIFGVNKDSVMANGSVSVKSSSTVDAPHVPRTVHDVNDLTKGEERVKISWVNNTTNDFPPPFHYIPRNLVFRDAYVNISLSRIGNEDCCSACLGNCVLSSKPCSCTNKTGGEFAYTAQGLLKEEFLEECIAISRDPQNYFYCKACPLETSKNDDCLEPCKGHLKRKFIKECWSKCGCGKHCGNRVVQRGISCNLQVFLTSDGKGWGLRTLDDLPKGAFVCEFVGEILTAKELHDRNMKYPKNGKYTYPILLDADWGSGIVKDSEALCLYAASYGNAARFINHRCLDANLIEIPVEIEGPSHHYYHFAFFTSRKIAAQEELTWDYGINFDEHDEPVELFQCRCGSKFCRNIKRSNSEFNLSFMCNVQFVSLST
uniref:Histone-lysine N-methyltransferase SUVR4 n=1 Tax=Cajanus cajan TaxID=3821 RepID=A0A151T5U5_CAJCA|nr:Histone-lysine N-methyltransferase SUVR4 [Cajanus cajan]